MGEKARRLSVKDVAQIMGVSERSVQLWCRNGLLPCENDKSTKRPKFLVPVFKLRKHLESSMTKATGALQRLEEFENG